MRDISNPRILTVAVLAALLAVAAGAIALGEMNKQQFRVDWSQNSIVIKGDGSKTVEIQARNTGPPSNIVVDIQPELQSQANAFDVVGSEGNQISFNNLRESETREVTITRTTSENMDVGIIAVARLNGSNEVLDTDKMKLKLRDKGLFSNLF